MKVRWAVAAAAALAGSLWFGGLVRAAEQNLVPNGNFETPNDKGDLPAGWFSDQPAKVKYEAGNSGHWVRFKDGGRIQFLLELKPEWKWLRMAATMRTTGIQVGAETWHAPRMAVSFKVKGKDEWKVLEQMEDLDWIQRETGFQVPEGAEKATVEIGMYNPGTFEVDDVSITSVDEAAAKAAEQRNAIRNCLVALKNGKFEHGTFEMLKKDGWPRGWFIHHPKKTKVVAEGNNHYMEISSDTVGWTCMELHLLLRPEWESLRARARMKVSNLKIGEKAWNTSRIAFEFKDEAGEKTGGKDTNWPPALDLNADADWREIPEVPLKIPSGSYYLVITAGLQNCTGTFDFDNLVLEPVLKGGAAAPAVAGPTGSEPSADQRKAASQAPTAKLTEGGIQFSPDVAQRLQAARAPLEVQKQSLVAVGPGAPGAKDGTVKWPKGWTVSDPGKELKGPAAAPLVVLEQLPEYLATSKPEVVLLWGDAAGKRAAGRLEHFDWEDVSAACLRLGALPVLVLPAGPGGAAGGGGMLQPAAAPAEPKDQPDDLADVRMAMQTAAESCGLMVIAPVPRETLGERLGRGLAMLEKYVLARAPIEAGGGTTGTGGTGKTKIPGKEDEKE